jgi:hypothetical protein
LGEPGIGKTRLLEELAKTIQTSGGYVVWGRGFEAEMLRLYGVWVDIFQAIGAAKFLDELKSLVLNVESLATLNRGLPEDCPGRPPRQLDSAYGRSARAWTRTKRGRWRSGS